MIGDRWVDVAALHVGDCLRIGAVGTDDKLGSVEAIGEPVDRLSAVRIFDWQHRVSREIHYSAGVAAVRLAWCPHRVRHVAP